MAETSIQANRSGRGRRKKHTCGTTSGGRVEDVMSRGDNVRNESTVVSLMLKNTKNLSNVRCRIQNFGFILEDFCDLKRKWVTEMGFEGLFSMIGNGLPRTLCYWLATRMDAANKVLESADGVRFHLSKVQVHWVLGLPLGSTPVPNAVLNDFMRGEVEHIQATMTSVTKGGVSGIKGSTIAEAVRAPPTNEVDFKRSFLMLALNEVLCPTTCHRFSGKLLPAATVYMDAKEYDWCSLVLDHLIRSISHFAGRFKKEGFAKGCGGCLMFLTVFYLDRLRRGPLLWGVRPRLEVWSRNEMWKAQSEDTKSTGDFGQLGCIDVAYGERHPLIARDVLPANMPVTAPCETLHRGFYDKPVLRRGRKRRNSLCNPYHYRLNKLQKMNTCGEDLQVQPNGDANRCKDNVLEEEEEKRANDSVLTIAQGSKPVEETHFVGSGIDMLIETIDPLCSSSQQIEMMDLVVVGSGSNMHNDKSTSNEIIEHQIVENETTDNELLEIVNSVTEPENEENFEYSAMKGDESKGVYESNNIMGKGEKVSGGTYSLDEKLVEDNGILSGEGPSAEAEMNALLGETVEAVQHSAKQDAGTQQMMTSVDDIVVISDEESNSDCNPFEELFMDFKAKINELDRIVSALKAAKSRAMLG